MNGRMTKRLSWILVSLLLIALICVGTAMYAFSGLPMPWAKASPEAYERRNYIHLGMLGELLQAAQRSGQDALQSWEALAPYEAEAGVSIDDVKLEAPAGRPYEFLRQDIELGRVVIIGHQQSSLGMVWAVTDRGYVIRIEPPR